MENNFNINFIKKCTSELLGESIICAQQIEEGMNSKVFRLVNTDSRQYVAKFYFQDKTDQRDRLGVEFLSLDFLWKQGVRCVPRPIASSRELMCAIYEFVEGKKIDATEVSAQDVDFAVWFLNELKALTTHAKSKTFTAASEAFFSAEAVVNNIKTRFDRLMVIDEQGASYDELNGFLTKEFGPTFKDVVQWCKTKLENLNIAFDDDLHEGERTLSPSDFGFHNALRNSDGGIIFVDFEYFGWDDPAKTVCDFLLHPAMSLNAELKHRFLTGICASVLGSKELEQRVEVFYPLFGLKWCMIFLNEFISEEFKRRHFASITPIDKEGIQREQLVKAEKMLIHIENTYKEFPSYAKADAKV